jgi:hypothetical protein
MIRWAQFLRMSGGKVCYRQTDGSSDKRRPRIVIILDRGMTNCERQQSGIADAGLPAASESAVA